MRPFPSPNQRDYCVSSLLKKTVRRGALQKIARVCTGSPSRRSDLLTCCSGCPPPPSQPRYPSPPHHPTANHTPVQRQAGEGSAKPILQQLKKSQGSATTASIAPPAVSKSPSLSLPLPLPLARLLPAARSGPLSLPPIP
ncbi:hypothetical protein COCCADRAFT_84553 [Bipolaris zeicola 26-R-13]|uniref:Uncharacterized protein n=1 Tax=Cochliobolus carbonum (strain 26-R-13) TaxID=930089 RepID=W6Z2B3_COCC2|nr:uncharacterized protein COCCADRAFT_84553 [Bipolaris zeicola 26-R-13]EUC37811.1 hypothetical protein COCCADRAFT_84553 [Bipolaris zeicola 26-R-13]